MVFLIILLLAFVLQLLLPWWIIVFISFITCAIVGKTGKVSLWAPFFAILLLWTTVALFKSIPNNYIMVRRVAEMLAVSNWWLVLIITSVLGGFVAGISGICGYHFRKALIPGKTPG